MRPPMGRGGGGRGGGGFGGRGGSRGGFGGEHVLCAVQDTLARQAHCTCQCPHLSKFRALLSAGAAVCQSGRNWPRLTASCHALARSKKVRSAMASWASCTLRHVSSDTKHTGHCHERCCHAHVPVTRARPCPACCRAMAAGALLTRVFSKAFYRPPVQCARRRWAGRLWATH